MLRPNGKVLGPRLGKAMQSVFAAARNGDWTIDGDVVRVAGQELAPGEYELALESPEGVTAAALRSNDAVVTLDTDVTPELAAEGLARDVIRAGISLRGGESFGPGGQGAGLAARRLGRTGGGEQQRQEQESFHFRRRWSGNQISAKKTVTPAPARVLFQSLAAE